MATLVLAGCGTSTGSDSSDTSSSAAASSSTASPSPSPSPSSSAGPARCTLTDLEVTLGPPEGAAGSTFLPVRLTNTSGDACRTGGFGGVSLVTSPRSEPVGAPADRVQQNNAKPIVLQPGSRAEATLQIANADNLSRSKCRPEPTKGLRVYPPNETDAAYVPHAATACGNPKVHLLQLRPYQAG
jgi:hypothetical protein